MSDTAAMQANGSTLPSKKPVLKLLLKTVVAGLMLTALLFLAAGRVDWPIAWVFVAFWFATKIAFWLVMGRRDPELMAERAGTHANTKSWDKVILPVYLVFAFITFVVAGLDAGRFGWSGPMSSGFLIVGVAIYIAMNLLAGWTMMANTYHSSVSRIQADRGHMVVTWGPYRYLRHPTYLASILLWLSTPLFLGSWWALIPGALTAAMMALRTVLEDRMLHQELPGYAEYAQRVRYRLLPGIW